MKLFSDIRWKSFVTQYDQHYYHLFLRNRDFKMSGADDCKRDEENDEEEDEDPGSFKEALVRICEDTSFQGVPFIVAPTPFPIRR